MIVAIKININASRGIINYSLSEPSMSGNDVTSLPDILGWCARCAGLPVPAGGVGYGYEVHGYGYTRFYP